MLFSFAIASCLITISTFLLFWPWVRRELVRSEIQRFRLEVFETAKKYELLESDEYKEAEETLQVYGSAKSDLTIAWLYYSRVPSVCAEAEEDPHPFSIWFSNRLMGIIVTHFIADTVSGFMVWLVITIGVPEKLAAIRWCVAQLLGPHSKMAIVARPKSTTLRSSPSP